MANESKRKLKRANRAECRSKARSGTPTAELARIFNCSSWTIRNVVNNAFETPDNVDSDVDYLSSELPMDRASTLEAPGLTLPHKRAVQAASSRLSTNTAKRVSPAKHTSHDSVGEGAQKEASSSKSTITPPISLSSAVRKRKPDEEEGTESIPSTSKAARTEGSDTARHRLSDTTVPMQSVSSSGVSESCGAGDGRNEQMLCESRSERREVGGAGDGAPQPPEATTAKVISAMISRFGQAPTGNVGHTNNLPSSSARSVAESPVTSSSAGTAPTSAPAILPTTTSENATVASFLSSQGRNLSRLLPTFIELGIKDDAEIDSLRSVPREENKKWFKELSGENKLTPLELHILLCALHV